MEQSCGAARGEFVAQKALVSSGPSSESTPEERSCHAEFISISISSANHHRIECRGLVNWLNQLEIDGVSAAAPRSASRPVYSVEAMD